MPTFVCYYSKWNSFSEDKVKAEAKCVSRKQTKFMSIKIEDFVCLSLILVIVLPKPEVHLDCFLDQNMLCITNIF